MIQNTVDVDGNPCLFDIGYEKTWLGASYRVTYNIGGLRPIEEGVGGTWHQWHQGRCQSIALAPSCCFRFRTDPNDHCPE